MPSRARGARSASPSAAGRAAPAAPARRRRRRRRSRRRPASPARGRRRRRGRPPSSGPSAEADVAGGLDVAVRLLDARPRPRAAAPARTRPAGGDAKTTPSTAVSDQHRRDGGREGEAPRPRPRRAAETAASSRVASTRSTSSPAWPATATEGPKRQIQSAATAKPGVGHLLDVQPERHDRHPVAERREADRAGHQAEIPVAKQARLHPRQDKRCSAGQPSFGLRQGWCQARASSSASPSIGTRVCSSESRSRRVTVSSSIVWPSTVMPQGVPISSWRR